MKMTRAKSLKEFALMLDDTEQAEAGAIECQQSLGDACRELRIACFVSREVVAHNMGMFKWNITALERRCPTDMAKRYRAAVLKAEKEMPT